VNLNSTGGTVSVNSPITVSSADPATGVPRRHSARGGNINLQSNRTGVAINISSTGQLLSLLESTAPGPGGKITILATATGSRINVNGDPGSAGKAPIDTIRADKGTVDIQNTGDNGSINLTTAQISGATVTIGASGTSGSISVTSGQISAGTVTMVAPGTSGSINLNAAQISADTVKIGALGSSGTLSIGGGRINANTLLQLYATGSNGSVVFVSDVLLSGGSLKLIAGNTVTVNGGVTVSVADPKADIYVSDLNHANYSNFNGGNNSTTGKFIVDGTAGSPVSGANTHFGPPPPPPFSGGP
jgi:hypothetical protein